MGETFEKEISYLSKEFDAESNQWVEKETPIIATFNELSRTDKRQHKLHFLILALFEGSGKDDDQESDNVKVTLDSDKLYDLTVKAIKTLIVLNEKVTEPKLNEILNDSGAILQFGIWFLGEKITPFFSKFKMS